MKTELKTALDYVKRIKPTFLFVDQNEDNTTVRAIDDSKSVFMNLTFPQWPVLTSNIIVSNIPYLSRIMGMSGMMEKGTIDFEKGYNVTGEEIIRNILFQTGKTKVRYTLTDPRIETTTRAPKSVKNVSYTLEYTFSAADLLALKESIQLHETAIDRPENGFIIPYTDEGKLAFEFPFQTSSINLSLENDVTGDIDYKSMFPLSMFNMILQTLSGKSDINISIAENMIQFESGDDSCKAQIYLPKSTRRIMAND